MTSIQLLACLGMIVGGFLLLGIRPIEFTDGLFGFLAKEPENIRNEIHTVTKRKKARFLKKAIIEAQQVLKMTGMHSFQISIKRMVKVKSFFILMPHLE